MLAGRAGSWQRRRAGADCAQTLRAGATARRRGQVT
ncbi:hypothetical protein IEO21_07336 [Rhodonia placenta]|uniref:Uncharacterized protein n=1 Tax=Rhodonia placenta TaxID=104341 RepID=A0A8H7NYI1_9APHY|nr:hypothetical protein IEO21_07336 [Postia placenta]